MRNMQIILFLSILISSHIISQKIHSSIDSSKADKSECNISNCPYPNGVCYKNSCICSEMFYTYKDNTASNQQYCNYDRKNHIYAVLLEFFFGIGIGHIYARNYFLGFYKILFWFTIYLFNWGTKCNGNCNFSCNSENQNIQSQTLHKTSRRMVYVSFRLILILIAWYLFDLIMYGANIYTDGNGEKLI